MPKLAVSLLTPTNFRRAGASFALLLCVVFTHPSAIAQNTSPSAAQTPATAPNSQTIQPVTTTVVVQSQVNDDYLPTDLTVGSLDNIPLASAPVSATLVTRDLMNDQVSRLLSDIVKNDASIGEDYAPVGYYGDYEIRGFAIDLATGLQINGMPIAGEQDVPLENKQRVEFLKGIAGVESGITAAGGLIDYVTKRPALVKTIELATDHRGTAYAAADLGQLLGKTRQFGIRSNMAGEDIHTYVESANGWRGMGSLATDWKLSNAASWKTDFEYQHKRERSVAGYQLLGGTVVPSLRQVYPSVMLGNQVWSKPNIFDAINGSSRLDLDVTPAWHVYFAGSYSHSLIDDNVIYPYGCIYETACSYLGGPSPYWFFAPNGAYDIYDYRDPGERRFDAEGEAIAAGHVKLDGLTHNIVFGGALFHRGVYLPGPSPCDPGNPSCIIQNGAVYTYIGSESIYHANVEYPIESPVQQAGPLSLSDYDHQSSGIVQDRVDLPYRIRLTAGGRYASIADIDFLGERKSVWLPQYSATYAPVRDLTLYGSYSVILSLGPEAPFWALNVPNAGYLAPFYTRQVEAGAKYEPDQRILVTASFFRMRAPFFYPRVIDAPDATCAQVTSPGQCFEADGRETHDGVELGAQGKAARWLSLSATAAGILAKSDDSSTPAFNDKQVINQPRIRTALFADLALPRLGVLHLSDFHLMPGWSYTSRKEATRDDVVSVGGYNLFNLGARYSPGGESGRLAFRIYADNILDKRYWKDTGASYGDTFIHLGAPTTVRLSGQYRF